jgi:aminopeptidase
VNWSADRDGNFLMRFFKIEGSRRFGEVAIGMNEGINRFTKNILFDEKTGGTIHMAIGASYPETGGKNESSLHWDLINDMRDGGKIFADGVCVYENGRFVW